MASLFKIISRLLLLLVVVLVIAVIAIPAFLDPNDYKDKIAAEVKQATGRDLTIKGDLELSVFPWLGLKTGALSLGSAEGFASEPFAEVANADVAVRVLPLLQGRLETRTITLRGLRLNLVRDVNGIGNWEDLVARSEQPAPVPGKSKTAQETGAASTKPSAGHAIAGLVVEDAELHWSDAASGQDVVLDDIDLKTGALIQGQPIDLHLDLGVKNSAPEIQGNVVLDAVMHVDPEAKRIRLEGMRLVSKLAGQGIPTGELNADLQANGLLDVLAETVHLEQVKLILDESHFDGDLRMVGFSHPKIDFKLALDQINVDSYTSASSVQKAQAPSTAGEPAITKDSQGSPPATSGGMAPPAGVPLDTLRDLNLNGDLTIGVLKVSRVQLQNVALKLSAADGIVRLAPMNLALYGGALAGNVELDARTDKLKSHVKWNLKGVQLGPLLTDLNGKNSLSGTAKLDADLNLVGNTAEAMTRSLSGHGALALNDGSYTGIDLLYELRLARALIKGKTLPPPGRAVTDFAELSGTFKIRNGVVANKDFSAKSPVLRVRGAGKIDLPRQALNYGLDVKISGSLEGQQGRELEELKGYEVPVTVTGSLSDPKVGVNLEKLLKGELGRQIQKKLDKKLGGWLGTGEGSGGGNDSGSSGSATDTLKKAVPGVLKGLFN